jgi:Raf kinase inhibitor-like YbhB/YbcL family protein
MNQSIRRVLIAGASAWTLVAAGSLAQAADPFKLISSTLEDNAPLAVKNAGNNKQNPNCVGENVSPPLAWSNPPAGTTSYALIMYDPEGRGGLGVVHWVAYGIPASVTGFAEGEVSGPSDKYVGGKSTPGLAHYFGPCTPPGDWHHYTFTARVPRVYHVPGSLLRSPQKRHYSNRHTQWVGCAGFVRRGGARLSWGTIGRSGTEWGF